MAKKPKLPTPVKYSPLTLGSKRTPQTYKRVLKKMKSVDTQPERVPHYN